MGCCTGVLTSLACPWTSYSFNFKLHEEESDRRRPTIRCFFTGLGRTPITPALAFVFETPFPLTTPFIYVDSAGGGTPLTGIVPSSRSRFFPLSESELALVGVDTMGGGTGSCLIFSVGAVGGSLGAVEPGLGAVEPGRGAVEPGRGTIDDWGLGVPAGLGVDEMEDDIWSVAEAPL